MDAKLSPRPKSQDKPARSFRKLQAVKQFTVETPEKIFLPFQTSPEKFNRADVIVSNYRSDGPKQKIAVFSSPRQSTLNSPKNPPDSIYDLNSRRSTQQSQNHIRSATTVLLTEMPTGFVSPRSTSKLKEEQFDLKELKAVLLKFQEYLKQSALEKKRLVDIVATVFADLLMCVLINEFQLKREKNQCKVELEKIMIGHERLFGLYSKNARGLDNRVNEKFLLDRTIQAETAEVKKYQNDAKKYYQKNEECVQAIENEKARVQELKQMILNYKKALTESNKEKEKMRQDLAYTYKHGIQLKQKYDYYLLEKRNLDYCADDTKAVASRLQKDLEGEIIILERELK